MRLSFFDPEHVERLTPGLPWRAILAAAAVATAVLTAGWEAFWRAKGMEAGDYKNTEALWAEARRSVGPRSTVIIGSSRIFFGVDLDVWEEAAGVRPIQLALEGTSPRIFLKDLAEDESFKGLVVVGVTVPLFFSSDGGLRASALEYFKNETPSQRADHAISKQLEKALAFIDEQTRPKRQVEMWPLPLREGMRPRFSPRKLSIMTFDRNTELWSRVEGDLDYQAEAKAQWVIGTTNNAPPPGPDGKPAEMPSEAVSAVVSEVKTNAARIRARGGEVAFVRLPYSGAYATLEDNAFPEAKFWDRLVRETASVGVSWNDHAELRGYELPEWSHLSAAEAERYTRALVPIFYRALKGAQSGEADGSSP